MVLNLRGWRDPILASYTVSSHSTTLRARTTLAGSKRDSFALGSIWQRSQAWTGGYVLEHDEEPHHLRQGRGTELALRDVSGVWEPPHEWDAARAREPTSQWKDEESLEADDDQGGTFRMAVFSNGLGNERAVGASRENDGERRDAKDDVLI